MFFVDHLFTSPPVPAAELSRILQSVTCAYPPPLGRPTVWKLECGEYQLLYIDRFNRVIRIFAVPAEGGLLLHGDIATLTAVS